MLFSLAPISEWERPTVETYCASSPSLTDCSQSLQGCRCPRQVEPVLIVGGFEGVLVNNGEFCEAFRNKIKTLARLTEMG
jgi:hypothetical protein